MSHSLVVSSTITHPESGSFHYLRLFHSLQVSSTQRTPCLLISIRVLRTVCYLSHVVYSAHWCFPTRNILLAHQLQTSSGEASPGGLLTVSHSLLPIHCTSRSHNSSPHRPQLRAKHSSLFLIRSYLPLRSNPLRVSIIHLP
jgi:hypothetical protein